MLKDFNWEYPTKMHWNDLYDDFIKLGKMKHDSKYFKFALLIQILYTFPNDDLSFIEKIVWSDFIDFTKYG
jgi:hypothetical protein